MKQLIIQALDEALKKLNKKIPQVRNEMSYEYWMGSFNDEDVILKLL